MENVRYIYAITITILLFTIFESSRRKNNDLLSPLCIFAIMQFIMYVPSILFATEEYKQKFNDITLFPVFIFQILFIMSVLFGYSIRTIKIGNKRKAYITENSSYEIIPKLGFILLLYSLGIAAKIYTVIRSGGILTIIENPAVAYFALTSGSGYLEIMKYFAYISFMLIIFRASKTKSKFDLLIAFIMIVGYIFLDLIYSRRSITITVAIIIIFSVNYFYKGLKIRGFLKPKFVLLIVTVSILIVVLPNIRSSNFSESNIELSEISIRQGISDITSRFSMVGRDIFVYNYFNINNYWLGKSYLNLPVSFVPSRIWVGKPAVDEGVYLTNLMNGIQVSPNESFRSLPFKFSIPFTTQGLLYSNFGIFGIIIGGIILGYIYKSSYNKIKSKNKTVFSYILYRMVIFELGLTVLTLTNITIQLLIIKITSSFFNKITNRSKTYKLEDKGGNYDRDLQDYN